MKLYLYSISADGESYTNQWLTEKEAAKIKEEGYEVNLLSPTLHYKEI